MSNIHNKIDTNISDDLLASSLPARTSFYRSLSAKRPRDPSHRKSVSFNDVPTVHEVPLHDTVRNSGYDTYRSWAYTDATPAMSFVSPFSSLPLHSSNISHQKLHTNRLNHTLYSSTNRLLDWPSQNKTFKITDETNEHNSTYNPPLIIVHTPEERINLSSSLIQPLVSENDEEIKHSNRSATIRNTEQYRSLPFTYVPLSESAFTYTSMLSTNQSTNDQYTNGNTTRIGRARSATLPIGVVQSSTRTNDNNLRITTSSNNITSRTVLKPATIAVQCTQPMSHISMSKSPTVPLRLNSAAAHARIASTLNRPLSSAIKYTLPHPITDTIIKSHPPIFSRSRSANILHTRRHMTSPVVTHDGQSEGINNTNLYNTTKRNPNMRQTYGSYYTHRVLLPTDIN
ncbi:unnamed protein product [Adineta steineri]|uniref:Uncharacterized protein n=1 Tax=Adineta steineri TaxID=433720 RepID=A0A819A3S4_9BILA|nr:unnamed protein product [Adineta steineri]CAF3772597.1 unnamed protein product [Adineta steineri]